MLELTYYAVVVVIATYTMLQDEENGKYTLVPFSLEHPL
jgi:NADH:ubiquinone oxidoreductase subunit E